jgi:hypothetical protein
MASLIGSAKMNGVDPYAYRNGSIGTACLNTV